MLILLAVLVVNRPLLLDAAAAAGSTSSPARAPVSIASADAPLTASLPLFSPAAAAVSLRTSLVRQANPHTIIPNRPRPNAVDYTVTVGDSVFAIAKSFNLKPESVLWANYDSLNANPDSIAPGMTLKIPPVDGVLYHWKTGDSVEAVTARFKTIPEDLLSWPGNQLDMTDPVIEPDTWVMIPNGKGEFRNWLNFTIPRGRAGVNKTIYGPGACDTPEGGLMGSGFFIWPTTGVHALSGNDYWDGHLGVDIATGMGDAILASDSGVVVYSGAISGGYGLMVMIDHGGGFQTVYAHLSKLGIRCGASVGQGGVIGYSGSTGNSTGPHLHFEIRYFGSWVNPWSVMQ